MITQQESDDEKTIVFEKKNNNLKKMLKTHFFCGFSTHGCFHISKHICLYQMLNSCKNVSHAYYLSTTTNLLEKQIKQHLWCLQLLASNYVDSRAKNASGSFLM